MQKIKVEFVLAESTVQVGTLKFRSRLAFTLAEVLITLGIIGVVAALTIPTVLQNAQEKANVTALKKSYTVLSQAFASAVKDNGTPDNWGLVSNGDPQGSENILNTLANYLQVTKYCGRNTGCLPSQYLYLNGGYGASFDPMTSVAKAQLADGSFLSVTTFGSCTSSRTYEDSPLLHQICGNAFIDVNGAKNPNQWGVDLFMFYIGMQGIAPGGSKLEDDSFGYSFHKACQDKSSAGGYGCTAWVLYNENQDYLRCSNLSWDGPTKCN